MIDLPTDSGAEKKNTGSKEITRSERAANFNDLKNKEITWVAYDANSEQKSGDWYFVLWTVAVTAAVVAFLLNNPLFGLFLIIAAFSVTVYASRKPKLVTFGVTRRGVIADKLFYPFSGLSYFSIEEGVPTYLVLQSKKTLQPLITLPVPDDVDLNELHEFLSIFLEEKELGVPIYQRIMDRVGF
jgi:hypothetical protein